MWPRRCGNTPGPGRNLLRGADVSEDTHGRARDARLDTEFERVVCRLISEGALSAESRPRLLGLVDRFRVFVVRAFGVGVAF